MFRKKSFFRSPAFNLLATLLLVAFLAVFYKFALQDYTKGLENDLETIDTERLNNIEAVPKTLDEALKALENVDAVRTIDTTLVEFCHDYIRSDIYDRICDYMEANEYSDTMWESLCGHSLKALYDIANGITEKYNYTLLDDYTLLGNDESSPEDYNRTFTLVFAGDVSLDEGKDNWWSPLVVHKDNRSNLLESAFSAELAEKMLGADIFAVNLESTFTSSDAAAIDARWWERHRSTPENVSVLGTLGVDMVNIANDHIYDYSAKGLADTLNTLDTADIAYIGGGSNLQDAKTPRYIISCGQKIALVSAFQLKAATTAPEATAKNPGVIYATGSTIYGAMISEAKEEADFVIAYIDWTGNDASKPDEAQISLARSFINAGADMVIGTRGKTMQSIEYYNGKPIIYGLGNFWYETDPHDSLLLQIDFNRDVIYQTASTEDSHYDETRTRYSIEAAPDIYCYPCKQLDAATSFVLGTDDGTAIINNLIAISDGKISIGEDGLLTENTEAAALNEVPAE